MCRDRLAGTLCVMLVTLVATLATALAGGNPTYAGKSPAPPGATTRSPDARTPSGGNHDYCQEFAALLDAASSRQVPEAAAANELIREGKALCADGNMLGGLHRLRLAKALLDGG